MIFYICSTTLRREKRGVKMKDTCRNFQGLEAESQGFYMNREEFKAFTLTLKTQHPGLYSETQCLESDMN